MNTNRKYNRTVHSFGSFLINEEVAQHVEVTPEIIEFVKERVRVLLWDEEYGLLQKKAGDTLRDKWTDEEKAEYARLKEIDDREAKLYLKRIDQKYRFARSEYSVKGTHYEIWSPDQGIPEFVVVKVSRNDWELYSSDSPIAQKPYDGDFKTGRPVEGDPVDVSITFFDKSDFMVDEFGNYDLSFEIHVNPKGTLERPTIKTPREEKYAEEETAGEFGREGGEISDDDASILRELESGIGQ